MISGFRVRSNYVHVTATKYLDDIALAHPPIPVLSLIKQHAKLKWHKDACEGFTYYDPLRRNKKYIVSIDKEMIRGRTNWTIAHELGHIILNHFLDFDINNLTPEENDILDREADIFAREILMPREWVKTYCEHPLTISILAKLKNSFAVSWQAITFRLDELNLYSKDFILSLHEARKVQKVIQMHNATNDSEEINCDLCIPEKRSVMEMEKTSHVQVDENFRFLTCPFCDNTDFSPDAKFCKICGSELFNYCTNIPDNDSYRDWCGRPNVPDAYYCEYCGELTRIGQASNNFTNKQIAVTNSNSIEDDEPF